MEFGMIVVFAGIVVLVLFLIIELNMDNQNGNKRWVHDKPSTNLRTVGPCAVAVGVYKTYENKKHLEKMKNEQ